jgi:Ca2+-binding RTX toxin-like protein
MSSAAISKRLVAASACAALAAGALTAILVSGASAERTGIITIRGDIAAITIDGSDFSDNAAVRQAEGGGSITIVGDAVENQRDGCTGGSGTGTPVFCAAAGVKTITAPLGGGSDTISFQDEMKGITIQGAGFGGDDKLTGGPGPQSFDGGKGADTLEGEAGPDRLRGREGADRLRGGAGKDDCDGKPEDRVVSSCEQ